MSLSDRAVDPRILDQRFAARDEAAGDLAPCVEEIGRMSSDGALTGGGRRV